MAKFSVKKDLVGMYLLLSLGRVKSSVLTISTILSSSLLMALNCDDNRVTEN